MAIKLVNITFLQKVAIFLFIFRLKRIFKEYDKTEKTLVTDSQKFLMLNMYTRILKQVEDMSSFTQNSAPYLTWRNQIEYIEAKIEYIKGKVYART